MKWNEMKFSITVFGVFVFFQINLSLSYFFLSIEWIDANVYSTHSYHHHHHIQMQISFNILFSEFKVMNMYDDGRRNFYQKIDKFENFTNFLLWFSFSYLFDKKMLNEEEWSPWFGMIFFSCFFGWLFIYLFIHSF